MSLRKKVASLEDDLHKVRQEAAGHQQLCSQLEKVIMFDRFLCY